MITKELGVKSLIQVAEKAAQELHRLAKEENLERYVLRLRVVPGGCSGMQYMMGFDDGERDGDLVFEDFGLKVAVDPESLQFLDGTTVDYEDSLLGSGFVLRNPNVKDSCGCGHSFTT
jgi:iron-sulfur cluster assembly protein